MNSEIKYGYPHPNPPPRTPVVMQPNAIHIPPSTVVHIHQNPLLGSQPTLLICYNCHANVLTRLEYQPSTRTHLLALGLCIFGLIPCAIVPYFVKSCLNGNHYCPNRGAFIGTFTNYF